MASRKFVALENLQTIRARKCITNGIVRQIPIKYVMNQYQRFTNVKIDHALISLTPIELEKFRVLETKFMDNFLKCNRKLYLISQDAFHKDYRIRALVQFHGCDFLDAYLLTNIYPVHAVTETCTLYRCLCRLRYHDKDRFR